MTPDPKLVLALAADIVKVEEQLADLKKSWEMLFSAGQPARVKPNYTVRQKRDDNFTVHLEKILNADPYKTFSIPDLAGQMTEDALRIGRTLFRLSKKGRIESRGRGLYGGKRQLTIAPEDKAA